jgi:hypothetical protein
MKLREAAYFMYDQVMLDIVEEYEQYLEEVVTVSRIAGGADCPCAAGGY